jgi:hypothetical protein
MDVALDAAGARSLGDRQVVGRLEIQPKVRGAAEVAGEAEGRAPSELEKTGRFLPCYECRTQRSISGKVGRLPYIKIPTR